MLQIFNYNAGRGDCMRLRYVGASGNFRNIIIDTGVMRFGNRLAGICAEMSAAGECVDALILTHVDDDHIGGLLSNLRRNENLPVTEVWMNHGDVISSQTELSVRQNDEVYTRLIKCGIPVKPAVAGNTFETDGAVFRILWPVESALHREKNVQDSVPLGRTSDYGYSFRELMALPIKYSDTSVNNHASIVFEFIYRDCRMLFTGDAWSADVLANIKDGNYDLVKLPHHGSVKNISEEWSGRVNCRNYIICTEGLRHPDKQTIAKLLKWYGNINIYGSVNWWSRFLTEEDQKYKVHFVEGEEILWETPV